VPALDNAWKRNTALTEPPSPPTDPVLISSALAVLLLIHADGWLNVAPTKRSAAESYGTLIVTSPAALTPSLRVVMVNAVSPAASSSVLGKIPTLTLAGSLLELDAAATLVAPPRLANVSAKVAAIVNRVNA
jgi:hypothetical protein